MSISEDKRFLGPPEPLDSKFYKSLVKAISDGYIPLIHGYHGFYHLRKIREELDHLVILQIQPRLPEEVLEYVKTLKKDGRNVAIVDLTHTHEEYKNPFDNDVDHKYKIFDSRSIDK